MTPDRRSSRGLDALNFFLANVQTGFGPFIAVYLTSESWTQVQIGLALSVGSIATLVSQVPAGAVIDRLAGKRLAAGAAIGAITGTALLLGLWPDPLPVVIAEVLHGFASCMVSPAIAAISLALVGHKALGERLGRNARWGASGNGFAAALMGATGYYISNQAVFLLTAALALPSLAALLSIRPVRAGPTGTGEERANVKLRVLFADRRLLVFAGAVALFQLSNAAMLQIVGGEITARSGATASLVIAACVIVPQIVVALASPWTGRLAERYGRRLVLLVGFTALPARALLLATTASPWLVVPIQSLDGIGGAVLGVLLPLVAADIAGRSGHFNLTMGAIGLAGGIGATISSTMAGAVADYWGDSAAMVTLAAAGAAAVLLVWKAMPETRPSAEADGAAQLVGDAEPRAGLGAGAGAIRPALARPQ